MLTFTGSRAYLRDITVTETDFFLLLALLSLDVRLSRALLINQSINPVIVQ